MPTRLRRALALGLTAAGTLLPLVVLIVPEGAKRWGG